MPGRSSVRAHPKRWLPTHTCRGPTLAIKLEIEGIHASYGAVKALQGVSLSLYEGRTVALLGTNGNGKSTLMKCVMGMVKPSQGSVRLTIDDQTHDLASLSTQEIVNLGVALVPEGRRLFPKLTVEENLLLGAFRDKARASIRENLDFCLTAFPVLAERKNQLAGSMSGGQQQMLAIARAIMSAPRLLLVDEPSVGLSPLLVSQTITKLKELKDQYSLTVLMAEQNFNQAMRIADFGYIIVHGEIVFQGDVETLKENALVKSFYLGVAAEGASASAPTSTPTPTH
ncbi:MAG: ABC transporter ATP-binding protein [Betaproteobacteria bacterium]|nr:ABC transporter ATP-binding protein [Betaproteobacteria bacterium]